MPRDFKRSRRVEEQIQRIVAEVLRTGIRDPRLGQVAVNHVRCSRDLGVAWIHYVILDPAADSAGAAALQPALEKAAGFIRKQLAGELHLRAVPDLRFVPDDSAERARRLDALIDRAVGEPDAGAGPGSDTDNGNGNGA